MQSKAVGIPWSYRSINETKIVNIHFLELFGTLLRNIEESGKLCSDLVKSSITEFKTTLM